MLAHTLKRSVALTSLLFQTVTVQFGQEHARKVYLLYNDADLSPTARAQLSRILLEQRPPETWRRVQITDKDISKYKFIERVYHVSAVKNEGAEKFIADELIEQLTHVNGRVFENLVLNKEVLVPPIPPRVYTFNNKTNQPLFRLAIPESHQLLSASSLEDIGRRARKLLDERDGNSTLFELADPDRLINAAREAGGIPILPDGIMAIDEGAMVSIRLRKSVLNACEDQTSWLEMSPFKSQLAGKLALAHTAEDMAKIRDKARKTPLVIIDWISEGCAHGKKVSDVARYVLQFFNFQDLPVTFVDLNPLNNRKQLMELLGQFAKKSFCETRNECEKSGLGELIKKAREWLGKTPSPQNGILDVPQLVIQAVIWKYFKEQPSWVNISFSIQSKALEILQPKYFAASNSFGVAAANNDGTEEAPDSIPQSGTSIYQNLINVTSGTREGRILGGYSNNRVNVPVTTVGQSCGFEFGSLTKSDLGTSYAAPYVATAAWLKHLIDGTDPHSMRSKIVRATLPLNANFCKRTEGSGVFDAAALLVDIDNYVLFRDGKVFPVTEGKIVLWYKHPSKETRVDLPIHVGDRTDKQKALAFARGTNGVKVCIRETSMSGSQLPLVNWNIIEAVDAEIHLKGSPEVEKVDFAKLGSEVIAIVF
jgi:hypothetical protein